MRKINVIGAGLAGCEAAYQIAKRGVVVHLYEQKPENFSPAHKSQNFCELVCSNSLKNTDVLTSSGMLKQEMQMFDSLILKCATVAKVPAGNALAVDREQFSALVTKEIKQNKNIKIITKEVTKIDKDEITIVATGPLTSDGLMDELKKFCYESLFFFDAAAPIIDGDSIDYSKTFNMNRYNKGEGEYVNCPLNKDEYEKFYFELINAETSVLHDFEKNMVFESCMPVEIMAKRGIDTLRFGPLKPAGLYDEKNNLKPYAVLQLRRENLKGTYYNLVGFQTNLLYAEQKRVFSFIPALKNAEFIKYGVMHKNTYINSPKCLDNYFRLKKHPNVFTNKELSANRFADFDDKDAVSKKSGGEAASATRKFGTDFALFIAGQLSGVEGYLESCASGLICGINAYNTAHSLPLINLSDNTLIGAMAHYISNPANTNFQPINSNYAILSPLNKKYKNKEEKRKEYLSRSLLEIQETLKKSN